MLQSYVMKVYSLSDEYEWDSYLLRNKRDKEDRFVSKSILITGVAGFIGFHLAKKMMDQNIQIIGFDNLNDYYDPLLKQSRLNILTQSANFSFVKGSLENKEEIEAVFKQYKPEIVINLAAQAGVRYSLENPQTYIQSNIVGFANLLECCRYNSIKHLLFASSSSIYGNSAAAPFSTSAKTDEPISLYAATKKADELIAYSYSHLFNIPMTGMRFFTVYGPFGRPDMAYFSFTRKILNNEVIQVFNNGELYRDFTYIDDVVKGIIGLMASSQAVSCDGKLMPPYKVYNIGNNHPEKVMDFVHYLEQCIGKEAKKEYLPMQAGDVYQTYADITELEKDINFTPKTTLYDGLMEFVKWYKAYYCISI